MNITKGESPRYVGEIARCQVLAHYDSMRGRFRSFSMKNPAFRNNIQLSSLEMRGKIACWFSSTPEIIIVAYLDDKRSLLELRRARAIVLEGAQLSKLLPQCWIPR